MTSDNGHYARLRVRQLEGVEGLRRRLARERFYPHPPTILTPAPSPTSGEGGEREFRQVIPRPDVVFILGGQAKSHPLAWGMEKASPDDRTWERVSRLDDEMQQRLGRIYAAAMGG